MMSNSETIKLNIFEEPNPLSNQKGGAKAMFMCSTLVNRISDQHNNLSSEQTSALIDSNQ